MDMLKLVKVEFALFDSNKGQYLLLFLSRSLTSRLFTYSFCLLQPSWNKVQKLNIYKLPGVELNGRPYLPTLRQKTIFTYI